MRLFSRYEQSEGIFFAPREDTGIIAFVLVKKSSLKMDEDYRHTWLNQEIKKTG
jgi:hypothetical protein